MKLNWLTFWAIICLLFTARAVWSKPTCEELLVEATQLARLKARVFMDRSPYIARRLAMGEEDLVQEFLISAWRAVDAYDESVGPFTAFLEQRFRWLATSIARKGLGQKFANVKSLEEDSENPVEPPAREELDPTMTTEERDLLFRAIARVPRQSYRRHMTMFLNGMSADDIAAADGITVIRARKSVREALVVVKRIVEKELKVGVYE